MPDTEAPTQPAFRAAVRSKSTRWSVVYGERVAKGIITVGGLMVIVAVLGIMVFLFSVVTPLLSRGEERARFSYTLPSGQNMAWVNADEFQTLATGIGADGRLVTFHVPTGREILRQTLDFGGATATAVGGVLTRESIALGFEDGTVRFLTVEFNVTTTARGNVPQGLEQIDGRDLLRDTSVLTEVQTGDYRTITPASEVGEPLQVSEHAIIALDYTVGGTVERPVIAFASIDAENVARISQSRIQRNLMTGQETVTTTSAELPGLDLPAGVAVTGILLARGGDRVFVSTDDGVIYRYDARNMNAPILAERRRVLPDGVAITAVQLLSGDQSLVIGGEDGSVEVFFRLQRADAPTADGYELVHARTHANQGSAVLEITQAQRDKSFATLGADGTVMVRHSTSDQVLFTLERESHLQSDAVMMIFPRSNGVLLVDASGAVDVLAYNAPHPEITPRVLFGKVWYESYPEPGFTWQSTAGTDLAEPKYSLVPLVFGTIKAAFYAMLFATPISIMAAIYTSEFVHSSVRATVKPVMELMESLPTVVLGFLAALVIAPLVEEWIAAVLLGFIAVPMGLMLGAFVWQMLPVPVALRYNGLPKFALMAVMIIVACLLAYALGPLFELALFDGDFKAWTNGAGDGTPFMFLLQLPLAYLVVSWGFHRIYGHFLRDRMRSMDRPAAGRLDFLRWIAFFFAAMALSYAVALLLSAIGFDPRGNVVDSYQQRNALVVGFAMAFAVIPSIYTLCEDALNAVPSHLRAGSLAAGATPWQTAKWIVLPTAASGVFSAVMMGMGRAVGETMIVVMAAGNTPIMEWNIFSGLRTLSANIAIELPEAVKDGTNYRVLFLAALTLFLMTFFINTIAELIRQRFRKRAFNL